MLIYRFNDKKRNYLLANLLNIIYTSSQADANYIKLSDRHVPYLSSPLIQWMLFHLFDIITKTMYVRTRADR